MTTQTPNGNIDVLDPVIKNENKPRKPRMFKVLMLNDDFTTMDFVVTMLQKHFGKTAEEAFQVMVSIHQKGVGVAGVYNREIAETKAMVVMAEAQKNEFPLKLDIEPESGEDDS